MFLNRGKPKERKDKIFLLNASQVFAKGDPKNYIPEEDIDRIAKAFLAWREEERFSLVVDKDDPSKMTTTSRRVAIYPPLTPKPTVPSPRSLTNWKRLKLRLRRPVRN